MNINLWKGDTGIGAVAKLSNENGLVDLTDADVRFLFSNHEIIPMKQDDGSLLIVFEAPHTEKCGIFSAIFKVQYQDGRIEKFPDPKQHKILVKIWEWE